MRRLGRASGGGAAASGGGAGTPGANASAETRTANASFLLNTTLSTQVHQIRYISTAPWEGGGSRGTGFRSRSSPGRHVPIALQDRNGPCALLALFNFASCTCPAFERRFERFMGGRPRTISAAQIAELVGEALAARGEGRFREALAGLAEGGGVDCGFAHCEAFGSGGASAGCGDAAVLFRALGARLFHGWLPAADSALEQLLEDKTYNDVVVFLAAYAELTGSALREMWEAACAVAATLDGACDPDDFPAAGGAAGNCSDLGDEAFCSPFARGGRASFAASARERCISDGGFTDSVGARCGDEGVRFPADGWESSADQGRNSFSPRAESANAAPRAESITVGQGRGRAGVGCSSSGCTHAKVAATGEGTGGGCSPETSPSTLSSTEQWAGREKSLYAPTIRVASWDGNGRGEHLAKFCALALIEHELRALAGAEGTDAIVQFLQAELPERPEAEAARAAAAPNAEAPQRVNGAGTGDSAPAVDVLLRRRVSHFWETLASCRAFYMPGAKAAPLPALPALLARMRHDYWSIHDFLAATPAQLSARGLSAIRDTARPGEIAALFRNNHFSLLLKDRKNEHVHQLATDDAGAAAAAAAGGGEAAAFSPNFCGAVWERIDGVKGEATMCDERLQPVVLATPPPRRAPARAETGRSPPSRRKSSAAAAAAGGGLRRARQPAMLQKVLGHIFSLPPLGRSRKPASPNSMR